VYRYKHVEPSINFGIINSIIKLHLVGISTESSKMHGSMNIKFSVQIFELRHISEDLRISHDFRAPARHFVHET
jgi:hypothetical protein